MLHAESDSKKWPGLLEQIVRVEERGSDQEEQAELKREKSEKRSESSRPPTQTDVLSLRPPTAA